MTGPRNNSKKPLITVTVETMLEDLAQHADREHADLVILFEDAGCTLRRCRARG
jgi:hypothetical protein